MNKDIKITILVKDSSLYELYKDLIYKKLTQVQITHLNFETFDANSLDCNLLIIDINSLYELNKLKIEKLNENIKILIISPFFMNELKKHLEIKNHVIYNSKPLNCDHFIKTISSISYEIRKTEYLKLKETIYSKVFEESPERIGIYSNDGYLIYANENYINFFNIMVNIYDSTLSSLEIKNIDFKQVVYHLKLNKLYSIESNYSSHDICSKFYYINNQEFIIHLCTDITHYLSELKDLKTKALFFQHTKEGVLVTNKDGIILSVNKSFCKITGYTKDDVIGKKTNILSSGMHDKIFYENMWESLVQYGYWQGEIWNRRKNGEIFPEWLSISSSIDTNNKEKNYIALFTDISSIKESDKKLHFLANYDQLTGLLNRVQFENLLNHTIKSAQRNNRKFALMFIDLDHFKEINDTYGHNIGDKLLKSVASKFFKILRKEDILARIGGDEFVVILDNIKDSYDAINVAKKLSERFKNSIKIDKYNCLVTLSIGISIFPNHGIDSVTLIKNADTAMYVVKNNGRNDIKVYDSSISNNFVDQITLHSELKEALLNENLEIYFQPVIENNEKHTISNSEVLLRWKHKEKGFISPELFIELAEKHGLIIDLGRYVLKKSFEKLPIILAHVKNPNFKLSINVSAREFFHEDYVLNIQEYLKDFSINPKNIEIEITETHIMKNHNRSVEIFKELKKIGLSLAIDDFGTGYSSLSYLKTFPIDKLKIDKSFVLNFLNDKDDQAIVKSIIELADNFNIKVQGEGVESKEHYKKLIELGCDYFQGYYFSKPISFEKYINFIDEWKNNE